MKIYPTLLLFWLITLCTAKTLPDFLHHPVSDEFIEHIQKKTNLWKPGRNFPANTSLESLYRLVDAFPLHLLYESGPVRTYNNITVDIPESYDPNDYEEWTLCPSINEIRNQGQCSAGYAISAATVMTDRLCRHKSKYFHVSSEYLVSCISPNSEGCDGGTASSAFVYWINNGVVSGGEFMSHDGCQPWTMSCKIKNACKRECSNKDYPISFEDDLNRDGKNWAYVDGERDIQIEIMTYGPVVLNFYVYSDFFSYKSGVYQHVTGNLIGTHPVKVFGWGIENGIPYWRAAMSWGTAALDHGFFKFYRDPIIMKATTVYLDY